MELLQNALVLVVAAVGAAVLGYLRIRRRHGFQQMAARFGLRYSYGDPGITGLPFRLFMLGDGRRVEHVLSGSWYGVEVTVFDYLCYDDHARPPFPRQRQYRRFQCALAEIPSPAAFPPLRVEPEGVVSRIAERLGFPDIRFESAEFNRRYRVQARRSRVAYDLLDARMIRWLLSLERPMSFEVVGRWVLGYHGRVPPTALLPLIGSVGGFVERIPRAATSLYAAG